MSIYNWGMANQRRRKDKHNPHYGFLVSWDKKASQNAHVKGETEIAVNTKSASIRHSKKADSLAQAESGMNIKKDIIRSLLTISLVLILELVVYLAWIKFIK